MNKVCIFVKVPRAPHALVELWYSLAVAALSECFVFPNVSVHSEFMKQQSNKQFLVLTSVNKMTQKNHSTHRPTWNNDTRVSSALIDDTLYMCGSISQRGKTGEFCIFWGFYKDCVRASDSVSSALIDDSEQVPWKASES